MQPKRNKILRVYVKDKSWNSPECLQLYSKETPTRVFSCEYSECFGNNFFIEQFQWLLLNYVLVSERIFKQDCQWRIAFDLISSFIVLIREPTRSSTIRRAFVFPAKCYYHKIFETEVDDNLSIYMDESSPCGLSVTGDIKIYQCHVIKR